MKKIIITVAAALCVIITAIILKNVYSCMIPVSNRGIRDAIETGDLDVLFIGSSTFRANVDMPIMDEAYGGRVYDISYGGNELAANVIQYDELKKRSGNEYKLMVFEMGPMMLTQEVSLSDSRVIWDLSWEGKKQLWEIMKKAGNTDLSIMYEYFVTSGMDDLITYPVTEPFYATRYYKGAKTGESLSPGFEALENEKFDISKEKLVQAQADAVTDIIERCKKDGQAFVFIESPCYHRLMEDPSYIKHRDIFTELLEKNEAPYILASDIDFDTFEPSYFEDMNHMSSEGRRVYTKELIKKLESIR
ncbi:MAG: hypothetical protein K6G03_10090 [Lachnospiraceae bacterium]|nr:hypothetical protein [Lachnospiraceae bacterium]